MIQNFKVIELEQEMIRFWEENRIYPKVKEQNSGKEKFYFLQGPPYTSGRLHMGHAWNSGLKDTILRYKRMKGFDVWDRGGYDMHGLPTELKVQAKFDLKHKEDIEKFGLKKFADECMKFSVGNAELMTKDLWRMGIWMDNENAYMPVKNEFIENEWWLIKTANEKGRLYRGLRTLSWCASCETAVAKHEQEYQTLNEKSIFVKLKVKGKENEYLVVWTTTPWTIAFNLAVMVNPELDYVRCKVGDETWVLSKQLSGPIIANFTEERYECIEEFKGEELEGVEYEHPWKDEIKDYAELKKDHPNVHTVIMSKEFVDTSAGSGLVHCAPGCGPEDFEVGHRNNIPAYNTLTEQGEFSEAMGKFYGKKAKKDDQFFIDSLKEENALIAVTDVEHEYAHCWRCKEPVVFRATKQWFLKIEDLKDKMVEANKDVNWVPEQSKESYDLWTSNLRDNSITKQRFWGTPAPIWINEEDENDYIVIGSAKELEELGCDVPENLHKPWIDEVVIEKDGKRYRRMPDVLDVWIDAGTASWNCLDFPSKGKEKFEKYFPADFILEAKEQVRLWFSMLNICSFITFGKQSYKNVYCTGMITDVEGVKMSKSLGNIISPYEIIDKYGSDTMRYYLGSVNAGDNIKFSWDEVSLKSKYLMILWNVHKFLINMNVEITDDVKTEDIEERYILSRMNSTIKRVTELYDAYKIDETINEIEELYLDLSRVYIQLVRDKASIGSEEQKKEVAYCIYKVMVNTLKMFSTVCPFVTEGIYQNFREAFSMDKESIHLESWPGYDESKIEPELEKSMASAGNVIQAILAAREKVQIGQRWPLREAIIITKNENIAKAAADLQEIIKKQTNVKEIKIEDHFSSAKDMVKADFAKLGPLFGSKTSKIIAHLATQSSETILHHMEKDGRYMVKVDGEDVEITKDHLIIAREVPYPFVESEFKGGHVYINQKMDEELEAEGYSREVMRRVQSLRKKQGLSKEDSIKLYIQTDEEMTGMLSRWENAIAEKCGAGEINISHESPSETYKSTSSEKIKGHNFDIYIM